MNTLHVDDVPILKANQATDSTNDTKRKTVFEEKPLPQVSTLSGACVGYRKA